MNTSSNITSVHPPPRTGHISIGFEEYVLVWGGYEELVIGSQEEHRFFLGSDIWLYNCVTEKWYKQTAGGFFPECVSGACVALIQDDMYVFGGFGKEGAINVLLKLDLKSLCWHLIQPTGSNPMPVDKMVGWHFGKKFYIFGGFGLQPLDNGFLSHNFEFLFHAPSGRGWTNQFFEYDLQTNTWRVPECNKSSLPSARAAHAAATLGDKVYIFGGRHGHRRLNDLHCFDMGRMTWREIKSDCEALSDHIPIGRSWHTLTALKERFLLLFGGFSQNEEPLWDCWLFDTHTETWRVVDLPFRKPRVWHSACLNTFNEVLIFGGCTRNILANRMASQVNDVITISIHPKSLFRLCLDFVVNWPQSYPLWKNLPNKILEVVKERSGQCFPDLAGS